MTERWPVYEGGRLTLQTKPDVSASQYTVDNPIASGGGGPHDPGMEARMSAMEQRLDKVENRLEKIDDRLRGVEIKLGEVAGTLNVLVGKYLLGGNSLSERLGCWP